MNNRNIQKMYLECSQKRDGSTFSNIFIEGPGMFIL